MHANASNIWHVPAYLPYVQQPLTREAVRDTETRIGFKLPQELIELFSEQNGGFIRWRLEEKSNEMICGIGSRFPQFGVVPGSEKGDLDWSVHGDWLPFDVKDGRYLVPFDGDGHWHLCLDYRRDNQQPGVTFVDTEGRSEELIANSFANYLRLLQPVAYEDEFVLQGVTDIEALRAFMAKKLGMDASPAPKQIPLCQAFQLAGERKFTGEQVDPVMKVLLNEGRRLWLQDSDKVYLQLEANLVPRGYIPDDATCRPELDYLRDRMAKNYPGVAADAWIMCATDTIVPEVIAAVEELGIQCAPLDPARAFEDVPNMPH
jgi:hypothetical protein